MDPSVIVFFVFIGLALLRGVLVLLGAVLILRPVIDCPACFGPSFALHRPWLSRLAPWLEWRWCPRCGWQGPAKRLPSMDPRTADRMEAQLPLASEEPGGSAF